MIDYSGALRCSVALVPTINQVRVSRAPRDVTVGNTPFLLPLSSRRAGLQFVHRLKKENDSVRCFSEPNFENKKQSEAEEATVKYGLEAGLWKVFTSKDSGNDSVPKGQQAKDLLKRYGSAYLITSISFAIVSFAACYALVNAGVDVAGLLTKVGLQVSDTSEKVGTFAIAYAAHKALSPVRFPPTVALTPVVARWLGSEQKDE